jgi:hypothetical protein
MLKKLRVGMEVQIHTNHEGILRGQVVSLSGLHERPIIVQTLVPGETLTFAFNEDGTNGSARLKAEREVMVYLEFWRNKSDGKVTLLSWTSDQGPEGRPWLYDPRNNHTCFMEKRDTIKVPV